MTKISTWSFSFRFAHQRFAGITGRARGSGCRIPVGRDFPPSVPTDPEDHSVSYTMGTGLLTGVMRMGHVVDHPLPNSVEVKERLESYLYSPCGPSGPVLGSPLTLPSLGFTKPMHYFFPLRTTWPGSLILLYFMILITFCEQHRSYSPSICTFHWCLYLTIYSKSGIALDWINRRKFTLSELNK